MAVEPAMYRRSGRMLGPLSMFRAGSRRAWRSGAAALRLFRNGELSGGPKAAAVAFRVAFRAGRDEVLERGLSAAESRYPEDVELRLLRSDLEAFRGNYEAALEHAEAARLLEPESEKAAARSVRLHYLVREVHVADRNASRALNRFCRSTQVLWAVSKNCSSEEQFEHILAQWRRNLGTPADLTRTVRPLGNAALRVERFTTAAELFAEAAIVELTGEGTGTPIKEKRLEGKGGLSVIGDLREVLQKAEVPFFLAAGTALGVVRDGRPLEHDNDIDIGIFEEDWCRSDLVEAFRRHPRFDFDSTHKKSRKIGLIHRGGAAVDLFCFYREGESVFHDAVFVRWKNTPFELSARALPGGSVMLPSPADVYLTECYGDWRTPVPGFDAFVEGPNVEVTWPEYFAVHRVRRCYKRVRANDIEVARREMNAARPLLESTETGKRLIRELG